MRKDGVITAADMAGEYLTLRAAHRFLEMNGVEWSFGWFRTQVWSGRIPSQRILNSRGVPRAALKRIVSEYRGKI